VCSLGVVALLCVIGYSAFTGKPATEAEIPQPDPATLRSEIVQFQADGSQFLVSRNLQMPISSTLSPLDDSSTAYNAATAAQFMEKYGPQLNSLKSKMLAAKIWNENMERLYEDLNSAPEARTAASKLLDAMMTASNALPKNK
jgi:hypothetical protein